MVFHWCAVLAFHQIQCLVGWPQSRITVSSDDRTFSHSDSVSYISSGKHWPGCRVSIAIKLSLVKSPRQQLQCCCSVSLYQPKCSIAFTVCAVLLNLNNLVTYLFGMLCYYYYFLLQKVFFFQETDEAEAEPSRYLQLTEELHADVPSSHVQSPGTTRLLGCIALEVCRSLIQYWSCTFLLLFCCSPPQVCTLPLQENTTPNSAQSLYPSNQTATEMRRDIPNISQSNQENTRQIAGLHQAVSTAGM